MLLLFMPMASLRDLFSRHASSCNYWYDVIDYWRWLAGYYAFVTGNGRLEKSLRADHAGGGYGCFCQNENAEMVANHDNPAFDINPGDRLQIMSRVIILSLVLTISITATGPGAKTAAWYARKAQMRHQFTARCFCTGGNKAEDRGSR